MLGVPFWLEEESVVIFGDDCVWVVVECVCVCAVCREGEEELFML